MSEEWRLAALCAETDPEAFYPEVGQSGAEALAICGRCDVQRECLEDALAMEARIGGYRHGIRGGKTARQRQQIAKQRRGETRPDAPLVERIRRMASQGLNDTQIGRALGLNPGSVQRRRRQHKIAAGRPVGGGRLRDTVRGGAR